MARWFERKDRQERDLDDEIRFHLAEEARLREDAGASPAAARADARRAFGNVTLAAEATRRMWGGRLFEDALQDARHGLRLLVRHRTFALFSILSLALGIGATTAVFSLYDAIVLRTLPVPAPEALVTLSIESEGVRSNSFMPYPQFEAMRTRSRLVEGLFARAALPAVSVTVDGSAAMATALAVTGAYHDVLRVRPAAGRLLLPSDDRAGHAAVAVVSEAYWQRRFGGAPSAVGRSVTINNVAFTIVGIEPVGFFGVTVGAAPDVVVPLRAVPLLSGREPPWDQAFATWLEVMGRLRPDVPVDRASQELNVIFRQASLAAAAGRAADSDEARFAERVRVVAASGATGGVSGLRNRYERGLEALLALLGGVLCLASLNVAALLLSRSEARRGEIATRLALGAARSRIVRQLLTESALIAVGGAALGLLLASRGSRFLMALAAPGAPVLPVDLSPDTALVLFTMAVTTVSCLGFGLLPALRATGSLRSHSRGELGGPRRRLLDRALVLSQTALALVLVVCAGLFLRSLHKLWTQDTGYDRRNVVMFSIDAGLSGTGPAEAMTIYRRVLDELTRTANATSVSISTVRPVSDTYYFIDRVTRIGDDAPGSAPGGIRIAFSHVGPRYFETLTTPLRAGRDFGWRDDAGAPRVAIVSERLARHFKGNPIGQRLTLGRDDTREVVGVAADVRYANVRDTPREVVYLPFFQTAPRFTPTYEMKYAGVPADALRAAAGAVARAAPSLAVFRAKTLEAQTEESFARERLLALLSTYLAGFAWLLSGVGLYGLLACIVAQRTREFGLRLALGAQPSHLRRAVLRESGLTVLAGLAAGLALAVPAARVVRTLLFDLEPTDPVAYASAVVALLALAGLAAYGPARRASRIDPMAALRLE